MGGVVRYRLSGGQTGVMSLHFEKAARHVQVAAHFVTPQMSKVPPVELRYWQRSRTVWVQELAGPAAEKVATGYSSFGLLGQLRRGNLHVYTMEDIAREGGKAHGDGVVSGFSCQRWTFGDPQVRVCMHRGVMLESTSTVAGVPMTVTALDAVFGSSAGGAPPVPSDVEFHALTLQEIARRKRVALPADSTRHLPQPE